MLPDIGGTELLLIAAIALIVIGPKDLPPLMRKVGQVMAKMRGMASEFRSSFDEMARQSELEDLRKEVEAMRGERLDPIHMTAEHFQFKDPLTSPAFDTPAVAALEANAVEAPLSEPEEPTLFDFDAPKPGSKT